MRNFPKLKNKQTEAQRREKEREPNNRATTEQICVWKNEAVVCRTRIIRISFFFTYFPAHRWVVTFSDTKPDLFLPLLLLLAVGMLPPLLVLNAVAVCPSCKLKLMRGRESQPEPACVFWKLNIVCDSTHPFPTAITLSIQLGIFCHSRFTPIRSTTAKRIMYFHSSSHSYGSAFQICRLALTQRSARANARPNRGGREVRKHAYTNHTTHDYMSSAMDGSSNTRANPYLFVGLLSIFQHFHGYARVSTAARHQRRKMIQRQRVSEKEYNGKGEEKKKTDWIKLIWIDRWSVWVGTLFYIFGSFVIRHANLFRAFFALFCSILPLWWLGLGRRHSALIPMLWNRKNGAHTHVHVHVDDTTFHQCTRTLAGQMTHIRRDTQNVFDIRTTEKGKEEKKFQIFIGVMFMIAYTPCAPLTRAHIGDCAVLSSSLSTLIASYRLSCCLCVSIAVISALSRAIECVSGILCSHTHSTQHTSHITQCHSVCIDVVVVVLLNGCKRSEWAEKDISLVLSIRFHIDNDDVVVHLNNIAKSYRWMCMAPRAQFTHSLTHTQFSPLLFDPLICVCFIQ